MAANVVQIKLAPIKRNVKGEARGKFLLRFMTGTCCLLIRSEATENARRMIKSCKNHLHSLFQPFSTSRFLQQTHHQGPFCTVWIFQTLPVRIPSSLAEIRFRPTLYNFTLAGESRRKSGMWNAASNLFGASI